MALGLANVHMAVFPMYFVFILPYVAEKIVSQFLKDKKCFLFGKLEIKDNVEWKQLGLLIIGGILAGLINPSGLTPFTYTIKTMFGTTTNYITEHSRLNFIFLKYNVGYIIEFIIVGMIIIYPKLKIKLHDLFLMIGLLIMSFISVRHLAIFVLICSKIFSEYINNIINHFLNLKIFKGEKFIILKIGCLIFSLIIIYKLSTEFYNKNKNIDYVDATNYPVEASKWIKDNLELENLRIFNAYTDGSFLTLVKIPNFIDTRCDLFTAEFNNHLEKNKDIFSDCMSIRDDSSKYKEIFEKYNINACLVNKRYSNIEELKEDEDFQNVYEDSHYIVYVKNNE